MKFLLTVIALGTVFGASNANSQAFPDVLPPPPPPAIEDIDQGKI